MSDAQRPGGFAASGMEEAMRALADERRKLSEFQAKVNETSTTVHSKDRMLAMTFDGRGELTKVAVNNNKYRSMAPAELAAVITETWAAGRSEAVGKLDGLADADALPGVSYSELTNGTLDLNDVVNVFLGSALSSLPDNMLTPAERAELRGDR